MLFNVLVLSYYKYEMFINNACPFARTGMMCAELTKTPYEPIYVPLSYELTLSETPDVGNEYSADPSLLVQTFRKLTSHTTVPVLRASSYLNNEINYIRGSEEVCRYLDSGDLFPRVPYFWERYHFMNLLATNLTGSVALNRINSYLQSTSFISGPRPGFLDIMLFRMVDVDMAARNNVFGEYPLLQRWFEAFALYVPDVWSIWTYQRAKEFQVVLELYRHQASSDV